MPKVEYVLIHPDGHLDWFGANGLHSANSMKREGDRLFCITTTWEEM